MCCMYMYSTSAAEVHLQAVDSEREVGKPLGGAAADLAEAGQLGLRTRLCLVFDLD